METSLAYRLNLEEIVYLSASRKNPVRLLYGLQNAPMPVTDYEGAGRKTWEDIKQRLLGKKIIWNNNGRLTLYSEILGHIIQTVSRPQALISMVSYQTARTGGVPIMTRLYVRSGFAAAVDDDPYSQGYYTLKACIGHRAAKTVLDDSFSMGVRAYETPDPEAVLNADMTLDELQQLVGKVQSRQEAAFYLFCSRKGIQREQALDLFEAVAQKRPLISYAVHAFNTKDSGGARRAQASVIYGGAKYMWKIDMTPVGAEISVTSPEDVKNETLAMSRLMNFV